jgi:hypothetical protein
MIQIQRICFTNNHVSALGKVHSFCIELNNICIAIPYLH